MLLNCGVREDSWESLGLQGDQTVNPKGNQSWIFIGRTDAEAPILWPPYVKNWFIWKDPDAGKDWRQEKKGTTENEMVGWHHQLNGHEFEQALGVGDGQGSLACCSPWGLEESDTTEQFHFHFSLSCIGEGHGSPLQCSCLENPRAGEPGGLPSMGSHRVRHDWANELNWTETIYQKKEAILTLLTHLSV